MKIFRMSILFALAACGGTDETTANVSVATVDTSGLVGRWTFDEGSGDRTIDSSGAGNSATIQSTP